MTKKLIIIGLTLVLCLQGCRNWDERHSDGAVIGGLAGAGAGALIGSKTGSWGWGMGIGAVAGAALGYAIADSTEDRHEVRSAPPPVYADDSARRREEADRNFRIAMEARDSATSEYHLKRSIEAYPTPAAYNNLGILYLNNGDRDAARQNFREAIALDPHYDPALKNLERLGSS